MTLCHHIISWWFPCGNGQCKWKVPQVWLSHWQSLAKSGIPLCTLLAPYFRSNQDLQNKHFEKNILEKNIPKVSWKLHCPTNQTWHRDTVTPYEGSQISWHHLTVWVFWGSDSMQRSRSSTWRSWPRTQQVCASGAKTGCHDARYWMSTVNQSMKRS